MAKLNKPVAIRFTPFFAKKAGWDKDVAKLCAVLGFKEIYPSTGDFVTAVYNWQKANPPLKADGMLGTKTWKKLLPKVADYKGQTNFVGLPPSWSAKYANQNAIRSPASAQNSVPAIVQNPDKEDEVIKEMVEVVSKQKSDMYVAIAVSGKYAAEQGFPRGVRKNYTGLPHTQWLEIGQQWNSLGGRRTIVGVSGGGALGGVIFVTDSGQAYDQRVVGFESDMMAYHYVNLSKKLAPLKKFLDITTAALIGAIAAWNPAAGALIFVGTSTQWMLEHEEDMPTYIYVAERLMKARKELKEIAPTLYDKVLSIVFKKINDEIPESFSEDPIVIARFIGGMLHKIGRMVYLRDMSSFFNLLGVYLEIVFAVIRSIPGAAKIATDGDINKLTEDLKTAGAIVSLSDATKIMDEVTKNHVQIKRIFDDLDATMLLLEQNKAKKGQK